MQQAGHSSMASPAGFHLSDQMLVASGLFMGIFCVCLGDYQQVAVYVESADLSMVRSTKLDGNPTPQERRRQIPQLLEGVLLS